MVFSSPFFYPRRGVQRYYIILYIYIYTHNCPSRGYELHQYLQNCAKCVFSTLGGVFSSFWIILSIFRIIEHFRFFQFLHFFETHQILKILIFRILTKNILIFNKNVLFRYGMMFFHHFESF